MEKISLAFILTLCVSITYGQNTCIASNGDWGNNSTWSDCGGGIPQDGDIVIVPDNVTLVVSNNQYSPNATAPLITIFLGDDDGDSDGGNISFERRLNLNQGSSLIIDDNSKTLADGPGNSEMIVWIDDSGSEVARLRGNDVGFCGPIQVTDGMSGPIVTVLPIELISFTTSKIKNQVLLEWVTATETDNDFFTIERSLDPLAVNWEIITHINGAGNSTSELIYTFTDQSLLKGNEAVYYRLKQTDFDGNYSYSNIAFVSLSNSSEREREI